MHDIQLLQKGNGMRKEIRITLLLVFAVVFAVSTTTRIMANETYRQPEQRLIDIVDTPNPPQIAPSPKGGQALLVEYSNMLNLEDLAEPVAKLAGLDILQRYNIKKRNYYVKEISLLDFATKNQEKIQLPAEGRLGFPTWLLDGKRFIAACYKPGGSSIWLFDVETKTGKQISPARLAPILLSPFYIAYDNKSVIVPLWQENRGELPKRSMIPAGPKIQESSGKVSKTRTFPNLLKDAHDEVLFEYFAKVQLVSIDLATGKQTKLGKPEIFKRLNESPDGKYLMTEIIEKPFSRAFRYHRFPKRYEIWDNTGKLIKLLAQKPLEDQIPIEGVPTGVRNVFWQKLSPATIGWVEALDGGDPNNKVEFRDEMKVLDAPFSGKERVIGKIPQRYAGIDWLNKKDQIILYDYDRDRRWITGRLFDMSKTNIASEAKTIFSRNYSDQYNDPGELVYKQMPNGQTLAIVEDGNWVYLQGIGATPEGYRPFLHKMNLETGEKINIFTAGKEALEKFIEFTDDSRTGLLTSKEDPEHPKNYFIRTVKDNKASEPKAITNFPVPCEELTKVKKELVKYKRNDGVPLSGTLYYPIDYKPGKKYPTIIWAYPREYTNIKMAGQVRLATNQYARIAGSSILFFVLRGYAVLNQAEIPVVGDPLTANDTFVEQIKAGAKAAVDKVVSMGIADPKRIGVAGHSYGAFMVANLLAHTDLFAAGIARSGAYNRSLTPFGFQGERRTFWEANEIYWKMSPFTHADKIKKPILLIHGEDDPNPGTYPIQSQRLYSAIKGHGGTVRMVILPYEGHGYRARESVLHVLAESFDWFDKYLSSK
jgi:dipeptidyl aminopeptidase/acylaminoacyl peptidase